MQQTLHFYRQLVHGLERAAPWGALLLLRILIGWEFLDAGLEKYNGENWFAQVQEDFLFSFNLLPAEWSWRMATWLELVGGIALIAGLGTRFFAVSLMVLTIVATAAVHWPAEWNTLSELAQGYAISNRGYGNYKLPAIFLTMLIPLLFVGAGKISIDNIIDRQCKPAST